MFKRLACSILHCVQWMRLQLFWPSGSLVRLLAFVMVSTNLSILVVSVSCAKDKVTKKEFGQVRKKPNIIKFKGFDIIESKSSFVVRTAVNIRAKPKTSSKKIGTYKKNQRVTSLGSTRGGWVSVIKNNKELGFIYKTALIFTLNGKTNKKLTGNLKVSNKPECDYEIVYSGETPAEGQILKMIDYEVNWQCKRSILKKNKKIGSKNLNSKEKSEELRKGVSNTKFEKAIKEVESARFFTPLFLSEGAYLLKKKRVHQVTIDFVEAPFGKDGVFSTTSFYNHKIKTLVSEKIFGIKGSENNKMRKKDVRTIEDILIGSVELAYESWNKKVWDYLFSYKK